MVNQFPQPTEVRTRNVFFFFAFLDAEVLTSGFSYQDAPVWLTEIDCRRSSDYDYGYDYFYSNLGSCDISSITRESCGQEIPAAVKCCK